MSDVSVNAGNLPKLIDPRQVSGPLTDSNKLDHLLLRKPHQFGQLVSYLIGKSRLLPMQCLTEAMGRSAVMETQQIESNIFQWEVAYQNDKLVKITVAPSATTNLGLNQQPVQVVVEDQWFAGVDEVRLDSGKICKVISEPVKVGGGWQLTLQFADPNDYFDPEDLIVGARLSKAWAAVPELSDRGSYVDFFTPAKFENYFTTHRMQHSISAEAMKQKIAIQLYKSDGTPVTSWIEKAKWDAMQQLLIKEDLQLLYGKMSKGTQLGPNGRPITQGAGLRAQIANRNKQAYNTLTYELLEDTLMQLSWISNPTKGGDFKFVALTGREGMKLFSNAILSKATALGIKVYSEGQFVNGKGMNMGYGAQFKTVEFPNGLEFSVIHCPWYDDTYWNRQLDPKTGYPLESSRFTIFNIGNHANGANLVKVTLKGAEMGSATIPGMVDINGNYFQNFQATSSALDGAEFHLIRRSGLLMKDPLAGAELVPAALAAKVGFN